MSDHGVLCVRITADRRTLRLWLVLSVEDGKKLRSERVIDFDHVDGSRDLPRVSGDDEGLSWPRICHGVCGARVSEVVFLSESLHDRRSSSAWQL